MNRLRVIDEDFHVVAEVPEALSAEQPLVVALEMPKATLPVTSIFALTILSHQDPRLHFSVDTLGHSIRYLCQFTAVDRHLLTTVLRWLLPGRGLPDSAQQLLATLVRSLHLLP